MSTIPNVKPFLNQLAAPKPTDGLADENANYNCGETDVAWMLWTFFDVLIPPDDIKDFLLGQGAASVPSQMDAYRSFFSARKLPVTIADLAPSVATITAEIDAGHPVVLLIPSAWGVEPPNPANEHSFHFVVAYAYAGTTLHCQNPWGGFDHVGSFAYWQARLRGGAVWSFSKTGDLVTFDATKYTKQPDGSYRHANGTIVGSGDYAFLRDNGINATPTYGEIDRPGSTVGETVLPLGDAGSEAGYIYWDGAKAHLNYWGAHVMISLEVSRAAEHDGRVKALADLTQAQSDRDAARSALTDMTAQRDAAKQAAQAAQQALAAAQAQASQIAAQLAQMTATEVADQQQIGQLQAQVAQLTQQLASAQSSEMSQAASDALAAVAALKKAEGEAA